MKKFELSSLSLVSDDAVGRDDFVHHIDLDLKVSIPHEFFQRPWCCVGDVG